MLLNVVEYYHGDSFFMKKLEPISPEVLTLMENELTETITIMLGKFHIGEIQ